MLLHEGTGVRVGVRVRVGVGVRVGVRLGVGVGVSVGDGVMLGVGDSMNPPPEGLGEGTLTISAESKVSLRPTR